MAAWVSGARLAAAWSSPLIRARETAEIAIGDTGLPLRTDPRLAELDFGDAEGLTSAQMRELFPDARAAFESDPAAHPLPGGERPGAALARALSCLEEISTGNPRGRVMVVLHTTLIRLLVCHLLGIALGDYRRRLPIIDHGALTELRLDGGQRRVAAAQRPARAGRIAMTGPVLAVGDGFVLVSLLRDALREHVGWRVEIREHELPWPEQPFGDVGEVHEASGGEDDLIEALGDAAVCVTQLAPITERVLEACPRLRFVGVSRGGPVNVNIEAATAHGVLVSNAPGRNATATAEFTIGLMLATLRRICETHQSLSIRHWRGEFFRYPETGIELEHATVGVLGYGTVGARVAASAGGVRRRGARLRPVRGGAMPPGPPRSPTCRSCSRERRSSRSTCARARRPSG